MSTTYTGTLPDLGVDLMLTVYSDGVHVAATRPSDASAWGTWSAPITLAVA